VGIVESEEVIHEVVKVGEKGQITIPSEIRAREDLKKGELLEVTYIDGTVVLMKLDKRGNLKMALELLGKSLRASGIEEKEDILHISREVRKRVHSEWKKSGH
jgi:AbrB family looped-hinge helix DNA binding protein